jgi:hypothetical protein
MIMKSTNGTNTTIKSTAGNMCGAQVPSCGGMGVPAINKVRRGLQSNNNEVKTQPSIDQNNNEHPSLNNGLVWPQPTRT